MTLDNKLGISNSLQLANEEEKITKRKALLLFETGFLKSLKLAPFLRLRLFTNFCLKIFTILQGRYAQ